MKITRLGDVAEFIRGVTFKPEDILPLGSADSIACFRTKNVQSELDLSDVWAIPSTLIKRDEQLVRDGDLLISSANSWNLVGKCCWVPQLPWPATLGGFISALRADADKLYARFLYYWFSSNSVQTTVRSFGRQTTNISNLDFSRCLDLPLALPALSEQRRIAAILDHIDGLRTKRRLTLERLEVLLRSTFLDSFGDPLTNPKNWQRRAINEVGSVVTGNTPSRAIEEYYGSSIEWIKSDNINTPSHFLTRAAEGLSAKGRSVARIAPPGSILVTCIAGSPGCIGNSAITDREVAFNQQINAFVPNRGDHRFLYTQFLVAKRLFNEASTSSMKGMISKSRFEEIRIIFPPEGLQRQFGETFDRLQKVTEVQRASLAKLDALFASLQHRAFRGEL